MTEPHYAPVLTKGPPVELAQADFEHAIPAEVAARLRLGDSSLYLTAARPVRRYDIDPKDWLWLVEQLPGAEVCMRWLATLPNKNPDDDHWTGIQVAWVERMHIAQILDTPPEGR